MTTSLAARRRTPFPQKPDRLIETPNLVRVLITGHRRHGLCTCGWSRRRRLLHSRSVVDALMQAAQTGCHPAVPLVDVDIGRRP
ncbi:hypothetical protein ACTWP6_27610 [Mycobacterium sp. 4D054]|uniref:hypothetical protein n=1 Tax=Mycobacteriaceae TaxID=1762 RepID=UPI000D8E2D87|nr:hypothetical protein [Mycolicibacterium chubuense]SPX89402.1 Uncharacterised protein [Mycolicibacterium chubuense]